MPRQRLAIRQIQDDTLEAGQEIVSLASLAAQQAVLLTQQAALVAQIDAAWDILTDWRASAIMVLDGHDTRLDSLESSALAFDGRVDALEADLATLTQQATAALTSQAGRISALETWRTQATAAVQALAARVTALENQ
ncbi:hypothetical protein ACFOGJ_16250 [Marinibaculum pumilum]|uniref:Uncharacterized protein n=1 Tax=Marinibaculum pumilum TaxID=1766165 RepID=A0ABV7L3E1_9PROT